MLPSLLWAVFLSSWTTRSKSISFFLFNRISCLVHIVFTIYFSPFTGYWSLYFSLYSITCLEEMHSLYIPGYCKKTTKDRRLKELYILVITHLSEILIHKVNWNDCDILVSSLHLASRRSQYCLTSLFINITFICWYENFIISKT